MGLEGSCHLSCLTFNYVCGFVACLKIELCFFVVFRNRYKTGNNIDAQETGFIKDIGQDHPNGVLVQHGEYQYEAPNGEVVKVQYTADGNLQTD